MKISDIVEKSIDSFDVNLELRIAIGNRLKIARKLNKLSQSVAAHRSGIHHSILKEYELGEREAGYVSLVKLSQLYGISLDWLVGRWHGDEDPQDSDL